MTAFESEFEAHRSHDEPRAAPPADPSVKPDLPVAVFRPSPDDRLLVAGPCHARALCLTAGAVSGGVAAVFVDPCGALLAIASAPPAVVGAIVADAAPFARLTEQLGASRIYLEVPPADAQAVDDAVCAALWPLRVAMKVLPRSWAA